MIFAEAAVSLHLIPPETSRLCLDSQRALINHEEGVHIQNPGYDLLQGYEVRADWWTSVGLTSLAVRFVPATPPTPLVKRCDLYCGTSLSRLVLQCHLQHAVFLVNILWDVLLFWEKVNEEWWNYYRWQQQAVMLVWPWEDFHSSPLNLYPATTTLLICTEKKSLFRSQPTEEEINTKYNQY